MAGRKLEYGVLAAAFLMLVLDAAGGAGWAATSTRGVLAVRLDHSAGAPLYDVLAGAAALLPFGDPAFRLQLLGAVLGALTLSGVVCASRAIVGNTAGVIGAVVLLVAPQFREALATPQALATCATVWAIAYSVRPTAYSARATLLMCAFVVGSAPWFGVALTIGAVAWLERNLKRRAWLALAVGGIGVMIVFLWFDAIGPGPALHASAAAIVVAPVVIGAGLLGISFGAVTNLTYARVLAAIATLATAHQILIGGNGEIMLGVFAIGVAIVPAAVARMIGTKRELIVIAIGAPLVIAALAMGIATDDPRDTPRRLVADLVDQVPNGPGTFIARRAPAWFALQYERTVAGMRPDLDLVPPVSPERADVVAVAALRAHRIAASDAAAFGRLDETLARPRGRGFQLLGRAPETASAVEPPADYASTTGTEEALALALERAEHEAASGRLAAAARALGLDHRFGAADLAVLSATVPTRDRPALFGFLPPGPLGPWTVDVFGDDLAWIANIPLADPPAGAPMPRQLHALWRKLLIGAIKPDAPELAALGPTAVAATAEMIAAEKNTAR
jgi:hypothetical protein